MKHRKLTMLAGVLLFAAASPSFATPTYCSDEAPNTSNSDGLSVTDMTFNGNNAGNCYGVATGSTAGPGGTATGDKVWPTTGDWEELVKSENGQPDSGTVQGVTFALAAVDVTANQGNWELSWSQTGSPGFDLTMDVVGAIKTQTGFASYMFEDLKFTADPLTGTGTWAVKFCLQGQCNNLPEISNLSLWYQNPVHTDPPNPDPAPDNGVPAPAPLVLIGLGGLLLGLMRRNVTA